ncbi:MULTISPECIES: S49 family peptidase [Methylophaga]|uniref:Signal peptide peptidase SppA n=1 Tax=Methylophaga marina TaxID=45495 RepID=A0ABN0TNE7_9GAMM|nr:MULTISPECIES: S49 family peptidase [Methylophaga]MAX52485.1 S49 family peptidase [Methylophaga sp.]BDZ74529.1 peptidase [Methylophaga marina]|tara:strand:+ start:84237 stop:85220 length:984 start_codon:yes stop_codon:yes gene_type:complete
MATFGDFPPNNNSENTSNSKEDQTWERNVLRDLAFAAIREQRNKRRWGYVFKGLIFLYLIAFLILSYSPKQLSSATGPHTAMVEISGPIASESEANADSIVTGIRNAFEDQSAKGLILRMNTPGGSPVQSGIVNDEIQRLKKTRPDFPVYAVIQDVCASGGYYIAVAADKIYADKASIVGSIGVRMDGFGFTDLIDKVGVERRSLTAGEHKAFLDPFLPMKEADLEHAHNMLDTIHQQFIDVVKEGRGDRLANNDDLFSGLFWSGEQAVDLGLIDGLANTSTVARDILGAEDIVDYTPRPNYLDQFAGKLGASISQFVSEKASWSVK